MLKHALDKSLYWVIDGGVMLEASGEDVVWKVAEIGAGVIDE